MRAMPDKKKMGVYPRPKARSQRGTRKRGMIQALQHALHEEGMRFSSTHGARKLFMIMMLRSKRLRRLLMLQKLRRLRLRRRLQSLEAFEALLKQEMALAEQCLIELRIMSDPQPTQRDTKSQDYTSNTGEVAALLSSFPKSKKQAKEAPLKSTLGRAGLDPSPYSLQEKLPHSKG